MYRPACIALVLALGLSRGIFAQQDLSPEEVALFEEDVLPIFEENCFKCHGGGDEIEGGLVLTSQRGLLRGGNPPLGSWVNYGLGSVNENLPGYVVMLDKTGGPISGAKNWSSGYMPASYQATVLRPREELYDLRVDPDHMENVASDSGYEDTRTELAAKLMEVLRNEDDPRVVESPCRFEHEPYTAP